MFNLNTNSNSVMWTRQQKMRKSSSVMQFRTLPVQQIVFNPSEFHVGESRISRLPQRTLPRRNSLTTLPRTQKPTPTKQTKQPQLSLLLKLNQKLAKQNAELKQQLQLYKKISRNSSKTKTSYLEQSSKAELNLKNIVVEKINRTKCSSRLASDNETGLYSSKELSYNHQFESINEMYDNFIKKSVRPVLGSFHQQLKRFFNQVEETFIKLKYLFEAVGKTQQVINQPEYAKCNGLLDSINEICQAKIQKEKVSKYPGLGEKAKSRCKVERQTTKEKPQEKQDVLELLSPDEVIERFEKYIQKVIKSQRIMKSLKSSLIVRKFTKKLSEV